MSSHDDSDYPGDVQLCEGCPACDFGAELRDIVQDWLPNAEVSESKFARFEIVTPNGTLRVIVDQVNG